MGVWIVLALGLASIISFPISSVLLYGVLSVLVLASIGGLVYRVYQTDLKSGDLAKKLLSDSRCFVSKTLEDFGIVTVRVWTWWLQREARLREEMAREQESKARRKERLVELQRKRRERPVEEYLTAGEREVYEKVLKNQARPEQQAREGHF